MLALGIGAFAALDRATSAGAFLVDRASERLLCIGTVDVNCLFTTRQRVSNRYAT
jgi:hypothetical protein